MRFPDAFKRNNSAVLLCMMLALSSSAVSAADDKGSGAVPIPVADVQRSSPVDFEKEVLPILRVSCLACHNKTKAKAKLILETPADIRKGGESGPAAVAGKGPESLLLKAASHAPEVDSPMPPPHNSANAPDLAPAQLGLIRLWIDQGASGEVRSAAAPVAWSTLAPGLNPIYAVAVTGDGQFIACGRGNRIDVYHLPTNRLVAHLTDPRLGTSTPDAAHRDMVESLAFSPDGMTLASGSYREIKLWRRPTPVKKFELAGLGESGQCSAASPDGKLIAVGDADGKIRLFETQLGKPAGELAGHDATVTAVSFAGDGNRLVSCSADGTLRVWDLSRRTLFCQTEAQAKLLAVAWVAGGKQIAGGGDDGIIRVWNVPDRPDAEMSDAGELKGHQGPVNALAVRASNDMQILSGGEDGSIRLWDVHSKHQLREAKHGAAVISVAVRNDGKRFASTGLGGSMKLWNGESAKQITEAKGDPGLLDDSVKSDRALALAKAEIAYCKARVTLAETEKKAQSDRLQKAKDALAVVKKDVVSKQNALDAVKTARDAVDVELAAMKRSLDSVAHAEDEVKSLKAAVDAGRAAANEKAQSESGIGNAAEALKKARDALATMKLDDKKKAAELALVKAAADLKKSTATEAGANQEVASAGQTVQSAAGILAHTIDALKSAEAVRGQREVDVGSAKKAFADSVKPFRAVAFSPDGSLLIAGGDNGAVRTFYSEQGAAGDSITHRKDPVCSIAFIGATSFIALGKGDTGAAAWDVSSSWALIRKLGSADGESPMADRVTSLDFSPDGNVLASGGGVPSRSGEIKLWDSGTGNLVRSFDEVHVDAVTCVRFSPDGNRLACASADRFARVISPATGKVILSLEGHQHHVLGVAWRRDGHTIATAGADNTLRFWNAETGERYNVVTGFDKEVTSVCFLGDSDSALATSGDGNVRTYSDGGADGRLFAGAADFVYAAAATPDGATIAAGGQDGILHVWAANTGQPIATFKPELHHIGSQ